jgi:phospholipid/cholesterol/gamma-HCH transport system permease protein
MSDDNPGYQLNVQGEEGLCLGLTGNWVQGGDIPAFSALRDELGAHQPTRLSIDGANLGHWDSILMAFLLQSHNYCLERSIEFSTHNLPAGVTKLLEVATAVKTHEEPAEPQPPWWRTLNPSALAHSVYRDLVESLAFTGEVAIAFSRLLVGKANTRFSDFLSFCHQAGPNAFGIISLTSVLVGMILAYLGAVQLLQFGAQIYVADLVVIGMLREMGVLMTAVVMAGRTGAAYAAQLGTMQTNEEIDAITTMGISPIEFLVMPRMLALVVMMPLLTIYANMLGIIGGGIVAGGMGISLLQYVNQAGGAFSIAHILVGILKSFVFAALIAVAGCRSGINSGRSSAAVGQAATEAVVTAIVYLIVADAAINILFQHRGI